MIRMERVSGRSDDMLIIRGVNVFPTQIEELILSFPALTPHYQIELRKKGNLDDVIISVEHNPAATVTEDCRKELGHKIKMYVGISATIIISAPGTLPRSEGKAKRVFDHR